jgi:hypothetical protein
MNYYTKVDIQVNDRKPTNTVGIICGASGVFVLSLVIILFVACARKKPVKKEQVIDYGMGLPVSQSKL